MDFLSRSQIQRLLQVSNVRNINRILLNMSKYLNSTRLHENIYYLNKKGRDYIGSEKPPVKVKQLEHKLMRNDMYMYYDFPQTWQTEHPIEWRDRHKKSHKIISDAFFFQDKSYYFVEVDHKQAMTANRSKIELYSQLFPTLEKEYGVDCVLLFYTTTETRKLKLMEHCGKNGITCGVFTKEDMR